MFDWLQTFGPPMNTGLTNSCPPEKKRPLRRPLRRARFDHRRRVYRHRSRTRAQGRIVKTGSRSRSSRCSHRCWVRRCTSPWI